MNQMNIPRLDFLSRTLNNRMNQANNPFINYGDNPEEFINNLKSMTNSGNERAKAGVQLICEDMKSKGLDNLDGYDALCSGTALTHVRDC